MWVEENSITSWGTALPIKEGEPLASSPKVTHFVETFKWPKNTPLTLTSLWENFKREVERVSLLIPLRRFLGVPALAVCSTPVFTSSTVSFWVLIKLII